MFLSVVIPFLAAAAQAQEPAPIVVKAYPWAPFVSPMGEPFRSHAPDDDPFARWFHQADRNQDGILTADEMRADAERFFTRLDANQDGRIDSDERMTYEMEIAPEVQSSSKWKLTRQESAAQPPPDDGNGSGERHRKWANDIDGYQPDGLQGAARYGLLNLPEPVAGADADFDRFVSLEEFRSAALYRFQLLDSDRLGKLTLEGLKVLLPTRPKEGKRVKRPKSTPDTRVGLPLPKGN